MPTTDRTRREGLIVGLIAFASVALFYSAFDFLAARGLVHTVDLLGKAVFRGLRDPTVLQYSIQPDVASIVWYSGLHLVVSLAIGLLVTRLIIQAEAHPSQAPWLLSVVIAGFVATVVGVGLLTAPMRPLLPWWSIVVANTCATLFAGLYLLRKHPGLLGRLGSFAR